MEKYDYDKLAFDLVEYSIWVWLSKKYYIHWQMDYKFFEGFSGGGYTGSAVENAEKETYKYTNENLKTVLKNSYFEIARNYYWGIALPSSSTVSYTERNSSNRIFKIENKHILLTFSIFNVGNSGVKYSILGDKISNSLNKKYNQKIELFTNNFIVTINCDYKRFYKGSPETRIQKKWVNEIMNAFYDDFDFSVLYKNLEKAY